MTSILDSSTRSFVTGSELNLHGDREFRIRGSALRSVRSGKMEVLAGKRIPRPLLYY
jgi:hypothetical protein